MKILALRKGCDRTGEEFLRVNEGNVDSVASVVSSSHQKKNIATNRHIIKTISDVFLLCFRQYIPIRGNTEDRSNFLAILNETMS